MSQESTLYSVDDRRTSEGDNVLVSFGSQFSNSNRTEWSPIRSVIIRVMIKSDDRAAGFQFVYHEYDYRPNWTTRSLFTN